MAQITTSFSQNMLWRLRTERIIWLTTISSHLIPQPRPVWFYWDGEEFLIYSQPNTRKLVHIEKYPGVSLHFDGDGMGGNIMVFAGEARVDLSMPSVIDNDNYVEKYLEGFARTNMSVEGFSQSYSIPIRVRLTGIRGR